MIIFKELRYQNLLATGNQFTVIDFTSARATLIVGNNGSGKSSMIEALTYALYGKALRSINLPQLINSITNKGLLVELDFRVGNDEYQVRRGMKPTVFEIFKNGTKREAEGTKEDQRYLEEKVLRMNFKAFSQNVVLGPTNYVPFMQLTAGDRRKVIENLLDIQVFTVMNELLKIRISDNNSSVNDVEHQIDLLELKIEAEKKHLEETQKDVSLMIDVKESKILEYEKSADKIRKDVLGLIAKSEELEGKLPDKESFSKKKTKLLQYESALKEKVKHIKSELQFFNSNNVCPTCSQEIDEDFKTKKIRVHNEKNEELESALSMLVNEMNEVNEQLTSFNSLMVEITEMGNDISSKRHEIRSAEKYITILETEIAELREKTEKISTKNDISGLTAEHKTVTGLKEGLLQEKSVLVLATKLLKDTGIKTKIISQYVPIINKLLNRYLEKLDLFVDFTLDENFNETVKSRYRDTFTYESFSEGEKARLNLALLLTWRSIAKMRNSVATNLLIMDEILDSAVDVAGIENLMEILGTMKIDENVIIISHSGKYNDQFDRIIRFEKDGNFSKIAEVVKE
jgi:DNA repair exonuclease SbcCD ATPase subunit